MNVTILCCTTKFNTFMLLNIFFFLALLGFLFPKSKIVSISIFVFIWILFWNETMLDNSNYEISYEEQSVADIGYRFIEWLAWINGLTYFEFKLIVSAISLLIYLWFTLKFSYYKALTASVHLLIFSIIDTVQVRNFVAFSALLLFLPYFFKSGIKNKYYFNMGVALSSTLHVSSLFYFTFNLVNKDFQKHKKAILYIIAGIFILLLVIRFTPIGNILLYKLNFYGETSTSVITRISLFLLFVSNLVFFSFLSKKKINNSPLNSAQNLIIANDQNALLYINAAFLLLLPMMFFTIEFLRIFRFVGFVNSIYLTNLLATKKGMIKHFHFLSYLLYMSLYVILSFVHHSSGVPVIIYNIFNNNILIEN